MSDEREARGQGRVSKRPQEAVSDGAQEAMQGREQAGGQTGAGAEVRAGPQGEVQEDHQVRPEDRMQTGKGRIKFINQ